MAVADLDQLSRLDARRVPAMGLTGCVLREGMIEVLVKGLIVPEGQGSRAGIEEKFGLSFGTR